MTEPTPKWPPTDPTENVKNALSAAVKRLDDLRDNDTRWQDKLDALRERAEAQVAKATDRAATAEKERLDALRAEDKANIALALARGELEAKVLVANVDTTARALAAAGGRDVQRTENRTQNQWSFQQVLTLVGFALGALYFILRQP